MHLRYWSNNVFSGNEIYDVASWAFHIYNGDPHDNIVESNTIHDFGFGDPRANGILLSSGAATMRTITSSTTARTAWRYGATATAV